MTRDPERALPEHKAMESGYTLGLHQSWKYWVAVKELRLVSIIRVCIYIQYMYIYFCLSFVHLLISIPTG